MTNDTQQALNALLATLQPQGASNEDIKKIVAEEVEKQQSTPRIIEVQHFEKPTVKIELAHKALPDTLDILKLYPITGRSPYLLGAAGSGKTTLASQCAEALSLPFYSTGALFDKFELLGFIDASGNYQESDLFKCYTQGGVFLFDEIDGSAPEVVVAFNQLLANKTYAFPNGQYEKHKDCYFIAAANTNGLGATATYNSRSQLDGATLDRFNIVEVAYDLELETTLALSAAKAVNSDCCEDSVNEYINKVREVRAFVEIENSDLIISPRATIAGAAQLAIGHDIHKVIKSNLYSLMSQDQIERCNAQ